MIEVMEDIPVMEDVQPILLLGTLNHPRSRRMRKSKQRQVRVQSMQSTLVSLFMTILCIYACMYASVNVC